MSEILLAGAAAADGALWHWLLGRPASENGRLRHGDAGQGRADRRRRAFMSTILSGRPMLPRASGRWSRRPPSSPS